MIRRQQAVQDFFAEAEAMRSALDSCFANNYKSRTRWQYFCDPRIYTYLRTEPAEVMPEDLFERFLQRLRTWCVDSLGLVPMGMPAVHLMVSGCQLGLHSDFHNGAWGYAYSLTRWDSRRFLGGETLLMRDGVPSYKKHHVHGEVLYELVPAHFNQLLIFDDRIVHGVPMIEGSMDPKEGRIALVGHIRATSPIVSGTVPPAQVRKVVLGAMAPLRDRLRSYKDVQGTITYKLTLAPSGAIESVAVLTDNLVTAVTGYEPSDAVAAVKASVQQTIAGLRFPAGHGGSVVTVPVLVPLPDLRPIECAVAHDASRAAIDEWLGRLSRGHSPELQGEWQGDVFVVREPIAGSIRVEPRQIKASFDPPMWVPSQRDRFETNLAEWMKDVCLHG